jgi:hypothetical protein
MTAPAWVDSSSGRSFGLERKLIESGPAVRRGDAGDACVGVPAQRATECRDDLTQSNR